MEKMNLDDTLEVVISKFPQIAFYFGSWASRLLGDGIIDWPTFLKMYEHFRKMGGGGDEWRLEAHKSSYTGMFKAEIIVLANYMLKVVDAIPNGFTGLRDALSLAVFDLNCYALHNRKTGTYDKALAFGRTIPKVEDLNDDKLTAWMLYDTEYLKYLP